MSARYVGRFAPSPTGPLHAGSLVAALASWLDARAHGGQWLVRIEDVDQPRCVAGMDHLILQQLAACGLHPDIAPLYQSQRTAHYQQALDGLVERQLAYPCGCSRKDIEAALAHSGLGKPRHGELVYPGTCRSGLPGKTALAWRADVGGCMKKMALAHINQAQKAIDTAAFESSAAGTEWVHWTDRRLGLQQQDVAAEVGDFVLKRADGCFAYQLAVVVDDAAQGITDIVRGADLADNTPRQILLQRTLGLPTPHYLHTPLVLDAHGEKLSKQTGALPIDTTQPLAALRQAARVLGLSDQLGPLADALAAWTMQWAHVSRVVKKQT
ncbi:MAG: tRNA glutamyl-Q(34) synthetase GluQRS [Rhodoferax sp.]|nr:tRNA glutamyl-Q(34) synthetase GluQRS [Rhodoferax sp.]